MILFKQDSYQGVILNFGLSYYLSSLGNGYVTLGSRRGIKSPLSDKSHNKQIRLMEMGEGIRLCPRGMLFVPQCLDLRLLLHAVCTKTENKADIKLQSSM